MDKSAERKEIEGVIEGYYKDPNIWLPPMNITEEEWDAFYTIIEKHFKRKGIQDQYIHALHVVIQMALFYARPRTTKYFTLEHLFKGIKGLEAFKIYSAEREEIIEEIKDSIYVRKEDKDPNDEIKNFLKMNVQEACKKEKIDEPDIPLEAWLKAFDVIKAHYMANNIMKYYFRDLEFYIEDAVSWSKSCDDLDHILALYAVDTLYAIPDTDELVSISNEISERIKDHSYKKVR